MCGGGGRLWALPKGLEADDTAFLHCLNVVQNM